MSRKYRNGRSIQRWHCCYALVLRALSSQPIMSGLGLLLCLGRHFLRPENGAKLPQQCESRHNLVCDQRLSAARPESQCPVIVEIRGTPIWIGHGGCASTLESASPLLSSSGSSWIAGRLTKSALNLEEPLPGTLCPWVGRARGGQSSLMYEPRVPLPHLLSTVPVRGSSPAETAVSQAWWEVNGCIVGPV